MSSADAGTCPHCGVPLPQLESRFCGSCGLPVAAAPAPVAEKPAQTATARSKTMMGVSPSSLVAPTQHPVPELEVPAPAAAPKTVPSKFKTMIGASVPGGMLPSPPAAPAVSAPAPEPVASSARGPKPVANAHQTMMGMPSPVAGAAVPVAPVAVQQEQFPPATPAFQPAPAPLPAQPTFNAFGVQEELPYQPTPERKPISRGILLGIVGVLTLLTLGLGVALLRSGTKEGPALTVRQQPSASGALALEITVRGVGAGTRVRHETREVSLDAQGRGVLELEGFQERVGAVELPFEIIESNGTHTRRTARLMLAWRVTEDFSHLGDDAPSFVLRFRVPVGAQLDVDGQNVSVDPQGNAPWTLSEIAPLDVSGPTHFERSLRVQVTMPDRTRTLDTYALRVPRIPLQVERPATGLLTAFPRWVARGRARGATRVLVGDVPATITNDVFTAVLPSPAIGTPQTLTVLAFGAAGMPSRAQLVVERVASGRAGAPRILGNDSGTAALLAGATLTIGQRLELRGQVLGPAMELEGGRSFQLLVSGVNCTPAPCIVWVDAEPELNVSPHSTVTVVGVHSKRRTWRNDQDVRRTDPVVHAGAVF